MNFDRINEQLHTIKTTKKIEDIHTLVGFLVESFGIIGCNPEELFMHASVQREVSRFMSAQGFRNQAAAYTIPHQSGIPLDIKLFWIKKTTKANLSWVMALTPNYEDNPETNANLNIGLDIVVSENCDSVFIVLSNNLKARVLELNGSLSLTQREIFDNWVKIGRTINRESEHFKKEFHTLLWKSFDFEPINRKFYLQLVEQFDHLVGHLKKNIDEEPAKMFAVRLIGRTLFLWFLRKKEFVNPEFDYFTVSGDADQTEYYREKLEPLFFEVLNTEIKDRSFTDKITPFLNGGLFEPIETDFYKDIKLTFPTGFFTQFFNVLNHYNFTVDEGTSEYEQVAVDPEMLGRVFENLLASLNPDTANNARDANGAFYTPREIVDYMCEQSLIEYLKTKLPDTANRDRRIEELVTMDEASFREQDHNKRRDWKKDLGQDQVVQALDALKILDPAVGSGAFPMGMLNLLVKVYTRIDTAREKDLAQLKRDILSRSLYGVDIDQMAIQISRLRAWLSILVDMENLKKAEPLPNLDFKFVCANTLISLDDGSNGLFDGDVNLKDNLIKLRDQYYAATRKIDKEKIRKEYLKLINTGSLFASQRELQLKDYNPFNPLNSSGFYDPTLMHGVDVFDVVIGNPPWVSNDSINNDLKAFLVKKYSYSVKSRFDLSCPFIELAIESLIHKYGIVAFVLPEHLWLGEYFTSLRQNIYQNIKEVTSLKEGYFESVNNPASLIILSKQDRKVMTIGKSYRDLHIERFTISNELIANDTLLDSRENIIHPYKIYFNTNYLKLKQKIFEMIDIKLLGELCVVTDGVQTANVLSAIMTNSEPTNREMYFKALRKGGAITERYGSIVWDGWWILKPEFADEYRRPGYSYDSPKRAFCFNSPKKIILRQTESSIFATIDYDQYRFPNSIFQIVQKNEYNFLPLEYILGVINSKLIRTYYSLNAQVEGTTKPQIYINILKSVPIKIPSESEKKKTVDNVNQLIEKKKNNINADTSDLESQIDELVMDLYGLNEEEKEIIRNS